MFNKCIVFLWALTLGPITIKAEIHEINNLEHFNSTIAQHKVLVKFFADWCGPCRASNSVIDELSNDNRYKDITFIKVNIDDGMKIANKYKIRGIPVFMFINKGKIIAKIVGFDEHTANGLKKNLDNLFKDK